MIHKAVPFLIASTLCSTHLLMAKAKPIADADIPKVSGKDLVSYMTPLEGTTPAQWRVIWTGDASTIATIAIIAIIADSPERPFRSRHSSKTAPEMVRLHRWGAGAGAGGCDRERAWRHFPHPAAAARSQGQGQSQWAAANYHIINIVYVVALM